GRASARPARRGGGARGGGGAGAAVLGDAARAPAGRGGLHRGRAGGGPGASTGRRGAAPPVVDRARPRLPPRRRDGGGLPGLGRGGPRTGAADLGALAAG